MSTQLTNEDGTAVDLANHLSSEHKKGARGFTQEYLASLHQTLHQRRGDTPPAHSHPGEEQDEELVGV